MAGAGWSRAGGWGWAEALSCSGGWVGWVRWVGRSKVTVGASGSGVGGLMEWAECKGGERWRWGEKSRQVE